MLVIHCLCQPRLIYIIPPYSTNAWRLRKVKSCVQSCHLCPMQPDCQGSCFLMDYTAALSHLQLPWDRTMNKSLTTVLRLLIQILFNCPFPWPLSSSLRTPLSSPQSQLSKSNPYAFANTILLALPFSAPQILTYSAGPSSCAASFKSSYIILMRSFKYKGKKDLINERTNDTFS